MIIPPLAGININEIINEYDKGNKEEIKIKIIQWTYLVIIPPLAGSRLDLLGARKIH